MRLLLPDQLKHLWISVEQDRLDSDAFMLEQQRLLAAYRSRWSEALMLDGQPDLQASILAELASYTDGTDVDDLRERCKRGNLLFLRNGLESTYADISSSLLAFSTWRFELRKLPPIEFLDLKVARLPRDAFDIVTAMDVFEHLADPQQGVEDIWSAPKPGGFPFGRLAADHDDDDHPQHIVHDFAPTMERMQALGLREVWRDEWLWGNQAFQKVQG